MIPDKELHYWAGVFDFAGSIHWRKSGHNRNPKICLGSKHLASLQACRKLFGGSIRNEGRYFRWELTGANAVHMVSKLYPYLQISVDAHILLWKPSKRGPIPKQHFIPSAWLPC